MQVVRADDRRIAARVPAPQPAFFKDRHIGDAKVFTQVVCRRQTMSASTDNDHVIAFLGLRIAPSPLPTGVMAQSFAGDGKG